MRGLAVIRGSCKGLSMGQRNSLAGVSASTSVKADMPFLALRVCPPHSKRPCLRLPSPNYSGTCSVFPTARIRVGLFVTRQLVSLGAARVQVSLAQDQAG